LQDTLVKDGCRLMNKSGGMREPSENFRQANPKT
jgi:hypothetical protein